MIYLNDFVNEQKFLQAMHLCYNRMRSNSFFNEIKEDVKQTLSKLFFHKVYPVLSGFLNVLTEPLAVNHYPTLLVDCGWLLGENHYYKLNIQNYNALEGYESEVTLGFFETDFGYSLVVIKQTSEINLNIEFFHFDREYLFRKMHSIVYVVNETGVNHVIEGRNHMSSIDEPSWCSGENLNKINPPYTVVGVTSIITKVLTKVETNDSNDT